MNEFMQLAIDEARKGIQKDHGGPFGAVIVKGGKVVASAHNDVLKENDPTSHAEIEAIREASENLGTHDLSGCELYTTGKPCPMCKGAIQWAKIPYTDRQIQDIDLSVAEIDYEDAKRIGFNEYTGNSENYIEEQVNQKECQKLYDEYASLDREVY